MVYKMKNSFILVIALVLLSSCDSPDEGGEVEAPREITLNAPEALKGCRTFHVFSNTPGYASMIITRCPSSITTTSTQSGNVTVTEHAEEDE